MHFVTTNFRKIVFCDSTNVKRTLPVEKIKAGLERRGTHSTMRQAAKGLRAASDDDGFIAQHQRPLLKKNPVTTQE